MFLARGAIRLTVFLFGVTAFLLYLVPVATVAYEVRYGLPPQPLLVISGTLGLAALLRRWWPRAFFEAPGPDRLS
jgi:choline-glycine betaine transporter